MNEDISVYCRKLRLSRNFVNNSTVVEKSSPQEYLLEILRLECEYREKLKIERLIKTAGFYNRKRFCDFCETRFFRATGSQYREPLARGDQSRRRGAESHRSKHKYKEPPELRRRRLFVFNQLNVWKYCL